MSNILALGLSSAAGKSSEKLWEALKAGRDCSLVRADFNLGRLCLWEKLPAENPHKWGATAQRILPHLSICLTELKTQLSPQDQELLSNSRVGLIIASAKGCVEDYVWKEKTPHFDPFKTLETHCEETLLKLFRTSLFKSLVISTACTSSLTALAWAQEWLSDDLDYVFIIAVDAIGPFVYKGFSSLKALSLEQHLPFTAERTGLQLGEAAGALLLAKKSDTAWATLKEVSLDTEGNSVTRPTGEGRSLQLALSNLKTLKVDAVIAHGTGTRLNDLSEDRALSAYFTQNHHSSPVTSCKWSIGHTLGASALVDTIAACWALRENSLFAIANSSKADPTFCCEYVMSQSLAALKTPKNLDHILITSLGFGGTHGAAVIERFPPANETSLEKESWGRSNYPSIEFTTQNCEKIIEFPLKTTPSWSEDVDRWSQLDAPAIVLCEAYAQMLDDGVFADLPANSASALRSPELQILASPEGSNETDIAFVASDCLSPAKFIHTLPNIRSSPLFQLMRWHGPLLCIQHKENPIDLAIKTAKDYLKQRSPGQSVWTWSIKTLKDQTFYRVSWISVRSKLKPQPLPQSNPQSNEMT